MRPPSVYAKPSCPAADPCDLVRLLHGPHRTASRLLMILLSQQGWTATQVADLLGYDPATVRRWIHRYQQHGAGGLADRPRSAGPGWAVHGSAGGSAGCWPSPRRGRSVGSTSGLTALP
jgi:hypothetical protein